MAFKPFKTLLFGFAFSPSLKANVYEATRLANYFEAALILLHVGEKTKEKEKREEEENKKKKREKRRKGKTFSAALPW